jgi:multiple sugar transport system substrate-binding protein
MNKKVGYFSRREFLKAVGALSGGLLLRPYFAQELKLLAQDVPSVEPITILINDSPWFGGFAATVDMYTEATGNEVNLDVTPFTGMLEKSRNATQASESEYDILNLNEFWYELFYSGGLLAPITSIDPDFELDPNIISYDNVARWDSELGVSTPDGEILGLPINGNIQLYYYRQDLFEENGIEVPKTFDEMIAIAEQFHSPPTFFGNANRANPIWWEFNTYLLSYGAPVVAVNAETGKWSIGFEQPGAAKAVEQWMTLGRDFAPNNFADLGQAELLALMMSSRLPQVHMVGAAAPNFDDPDQSSVVGKVRATVVPGATPETRASVSGIWVMGVPDNVPDPRKVAALTFLKWLLGKDQQIAYTLAGAIPVRQDAYEELSTDETVGWWTSAFAESTPYIKAAPRIAETSQLRDVVATRMAQAYVDEIPADEAIELIASECRTIMEDNGYDLE